jgi:hypothetical protein
MADQHTFVYHGHRSVELLRVSESGIWANPDIPVDEVAQRVFEILEPMIRQAYRDSATPEVGA